MKGRKPKPTAVKIAEGRRGHKPLPRNEPKPPRDVSLAPPDYLDTLGKAEWRRIARELDSSGVYTAWDKQTLVAYCQAYSEWREATRVLAREGSVVPSTKGTMMVSPWVRIRRDAAAAMVKYGAMFGLNPCDRARIQAKPKQSDGLDAGADFGEGAM